MRTNKVGANVIWSVVLMFVIITTGVLFQHSLSTAVEDAGESAAVQAAPVAASSSGMIDSDNLTAEEDQDSQTDDMSVARLTEEPVVSDEPDAIKTFGTADENESKHLPQGVSNNWWAEALDNIKKQEYEVTWQDMPVPADLPPAYQAPNRAHNLRTYFIGDGIRMIPRSEQEPSWQLGLQLKGYGYAGQATDLLPAEPTVSGNRIEYCRGGVTEWYENSEQGLRQGFTLETAPEETSSIKDSRIMLSLALTGDLTPKRAAKQTTIELADAQGKAVLCYRKVQVTDGSGRELPATITASNKTVVVQIDNAEADYPITVASIITGISSNSNWTAESNQANAWFGYSVATAGDVNDDGYADVIVGAPTYDNGQTDEGRAFVYHGSASGLSTTANRTA